MISRHSKLPVHALERIDEACEQFEQSWQNGEPARIENFLANAADDSERSALLAELLSLEIDYRRRRGEQPQVDDYVSRFSDHEVAVRRIFAELVDQMARQRTTSTPTNAGEEESKPSSKRSSVSRSSSFGVADPLGEFRFSEGRYVVLEKLGVGGFATVYRAFDQSLQRDVAVKVPHAHRVNDYDLDAYLSEARLVAKLDHPGIVPVYDTGRNPDGVCYVVSKLIKGQNLAQMMRQRQPNCEESIGIVIQVAEALSYAHQCGLVHRDLKPANILVDAQRKAFVTDFGLAMETDAPRDQNAFVGTPAYMSPEQAANESHLIDHRTDIFSLGVIFYEMLTGRRPYGGSGMREVLEAVREGSCASPRQYVADLSPQVDRICMRAIAPRISDRYESVEALRNELAAITGSEIAASKQASTQASKQGSASRRPSSSPSTVVIPRGLRSFDETDSDAFIELLPGPFDQSGLPTSLAFWLKRISPESSNPFRIGLLSGPSGSGKSSLVKAGLIPRLAGGVRPLFIEASAEHTEATLLETIHRQNPEIQTNDLVEAFAALRRTEYPKHCVFIDQFEQWLERNEVETSQLVAAFRHCDGEHLQCVLMVRDEFGMMAARLLYELDIPVEQGINFAAVSTLPAKHARQTLVKFGRALDQFPTGDSELSPDHQSFLDAAIESISENGRVVPVQLALFTEITRDRPWDAESLVETGQHGLGIAFLEKSFGEKTLHPECRLHRAAARRVLKALLPARNIEIKGSLQTREELLSASGYENDATKFDALIRLLDRELRLITPTEVIRDETSDDTATKETGYLLAHDFMVAPLREWLTQKDKQTLRGRAELCLAERASWWADSRAKQQLPSFSEWLSIRLFVRSRDWSASERDMMQSANRRYVGQMAFVAALILSALFGWSRWQAGRDAETLASRMVNAGRNELPTLIYDAKLASSRIRSKLLEKDSDMSLLPKQRMNTLVGLTRLDGKLHPDLVNRLMSAQADTFAAACQSLIPTGDDHSAELEAIVDELLPHLEAIVNAKPEQPAERRFRAASLLAQIDESRIPDHVIPDITNQLRRNLHDLAVWAELLKPLRGRLSTPLKKYFNESTDLETQRVATTILARLYADDAKQLLDLAASAEGNQLATIIPALRNIKDEALPLLKQRWSDSFGPPPQPQQGVSVAVSHMLEAAGGLVTPANAFAMNLDDASLKKANAKLEAAGYELDHSLEIESMASDSGENSRHFALWRRGRDASHYSSPANDANRAKEQALLDSELTSDVRQIRYLASNRSKFAFDEYYSVDVQYRDQDVGMPVPRFHWARTSYFEFEPRPSLGVLGSSGSFWLPPVRVDECSSFAIEAWGLEWSGPILQQRVGPTSMWMSLGGGKDTELNCGWSTTKGSPASKLSFALGKLTGWNHVAVVFEDGKATCYLNGKKQGSLAAEPPGSLPANNRTGQFELYRSRGRGAFEVAEGNLAAIRISRNARYVEDFEPQQHLAFDEHSLFALNVSRMKAPVTEVPRQRDVLAKVRARDRFARWDRHVFLNGFDSEQQDQIARELTSVLFEPVWLERSGASSSESRSEWQSRWSRVEPPELRAWVPERLANLAVVLWDLSSPQAAASALAFRRNNEVRSHLINRLASADCDPQQVLELLEEELAPGIRQALILSLGEFGPQAVSARLRTRCIETLTSIYQHDRNAGVHSAIEFLFQRWNESLPSMEGTESTSSEEIASHGDWIPGPRGHDLAVIETPNPLPSNRQNRESYAAKYGVGIRLVTHEAYEIFANEIGQQRADHAARRPAAYVTYYDAAAYCNWLSKQANIPRDEWCFVESPAGDGKLVPAPDYLRKRGYRLPTVSEWRLASAGGVTTRFPWGESDKFADEYAWVASNSREVITEVGLKKPNWCGLFDITGNVGEWVRHDEGDWSKTHGYACGAHRHEQRWLQHITNYRRLPKTTSEFSVGFRIARSLSQ